MDKLERLAGLMIETDACVRAVPMTIREVMEAAHADDPRNTKPDIVSKEVRFLEDFGREMLVMERRPAHAGMFLVETGVRTSSAVRFSKNEFYGSLDAVMDVLEKIRQEKEAASCPK